MLRAWSGVSVYGKLSSSSRCQVVSASEGEAGRRLARRVDLDQLARQVPHRATDAPLRPLPLRAAELAQPRSRTAGVAGDAPDLVGRQEDLVRPGEVELQVLLDVAAEGPLRHPGVPGNAMVDMDDVVAGRQLADEVARDDALPAGEATHPRRSEQLMVGEHQQPARFVRESAGQRAVDEADLAFIRRLAQLSRWADGLARFLEQLPHPAGLVGGHDHAAARRGELGQPRARPIGASRQRRRGGVADRGFHLLLQRLGGAIDQRLERRAGLVRQRPVGRKLAGARQAGATIGRLPVEVGGQGPQLLPVGQDEMHRRADVVGGRSGGHQRCPCLCRLTDVSLGKSGGILAQEVGREVRAGGHRLPAGLRQELRCGSKVHALEAPPRSLGHGVEAANRFDLVAEELDAHRVGGAGRPGVDQPAAMRELADAGHLDARLVAAGHEPLEKVVLGSPLAHPNRGAGRAQLVRAQRPLRPRQQRAHDDEPMRRCTQLGEDR